MKSRGFTLLEMVVSIFIFGLVGVLAIQLLTQSVRTTEKVIFRSSVVSDWHRAMNMLEQDFLQLSFRRIRDEYGDEQARFLISGSGGAEFTRSGWVNPLGHQRSELQRVAYFMFENQLFRRYWNVLDRSKDSEPIDQLLLRNVQSIEFEVIDKAGREHYLWPPVVSEETGRSIDPLVAVRVTMELVEFGTVSQMWLLPVLPYHATGSVEEPRESEGKPDEDQPS